MAPSKFSRFFSKKPFTKGAGCAIFISVIRIILKKELRHTEAIRKNSKKRQALLDALCRSHEHPTAEMLYTSLKPMIPELSLGTVYRNLGVLVQDGLVTSVGHVNGQERYDAVTEPHPHFVCDSCHAVIDLKLPDTVSNMYEQIDKQFNCAPQGYSLTIKGLCPKCR